MDDDFLHPERLLRSRVAFIQSIFPQDNREAAVLGVRTETEVTSQINDPFLSTCCCYSG